MRMPEISTTVLKSIGFISFLFTIKANKTIYNSVNIAKKNMNK